jgi:hypothetical protein
VAIADSTKECDLLWCQGCRQRDLLGWEACFIESG